MNVFVFELRSRGRGCGSNALLSVLHIYCCVFGLLNVFGIGYCCGWMHFEKLLGARLLSCCTHTHTHTRPQSTQTHNLRTKQFDRREDEERTYIPRILCACMCNTHTHTRINGRPKTHNRTPLKPPIKYRINRKRDVTFHFLGFNELDKQECCRIAIFAQKSIECNAMFLHSCIVDWLDCARISLSDFQLTRKD